MTVHHSRDTNRKQWSETRTLELKGFSRLLRTATRHLLGSDGETLGSGQQGRKTLPLSLSVKEVEKGGERDQRLEIKWLQKVWKQILSLVLASIESAGSSLVSNMRFKS